MAAAMHTLPDTVKLRFIMWCFAATVRPDGHHAVCSRQGMCELLLKHTTCRLRATAAPDHISEGVPGTVREHPRPQQMGMDCLPRQTAL